MKTDNQKKTEKDLNMESSLGLSACFSSGPLHNFMNLALSFPASADVLSLVQEGNEWRASMGVGPGSYSARAQSWAGQSTSWNSVLFTARERFVLIDPQPFAACTAWEFKPH